ncbi:hypothetical protein [Rhizosaccharibacter radicis]|uniref:Twin-arginine translocation pathway signal protein n=1 Tax=Rhizosaccharibacter radicis TaxID=2782605 RepID=A0ABT1VVS1_9PROT|nr:hypothetical protein [Acetobacteraceae bacterium KSS12]
MFRRPERSLHPFIGTDTTPVGEAFADRRCSRRLLLSGVALAAAGLAGRRALARPLAPETIDPVHLTAATMDAGGGMLRNPALLVAGPPDTPAGRWARLLAPRLDAALPGSPTISLSATGGRDGVTGANAFEALTVPDGSTALLVPGSAALAWLAGDPRVHFDAGRWVPALASLGSGVLMVRSSEAPILRPGLRIAASTPTGPELPALLGSWLLGAPPAPVFGLSEPSDAETALRDGRADAVFLSGHDVPGRAERLTGDGFLCAFSLGAADGARDPALPNVPSMSELLRRRNAGMDRSLVDAWNAVAAAARLDVALVLPLLAPAALVAQWREACRAALITPSLVDAAQNAQIAPVPAPGCVGVLDEVKADQGVQLALRRWIAARAEWHL